MHTYCRERGLSAEILQRRKEQCAQDEAVDRCCEVGARQLIQCYTEVCSVITNVIATYLLYMGY